MPTEQAINELKEMFQERLGERYEIQTQPYGEATILMVAPRGAKRLPQVFSDWVDDERLNGDPAEMVSRWADRVFSLYEPHYQSIYPPEKGPNAGKMRTQYLVCCYECERGNVVEANNKAEAAKLLRDEDWALSNDNLWFCPNCRRPVGRPSRH